MNVKAVLLDVDNTLLDFNLCAREAMRQGMEKWGLLFEESMFPVFQRINNRLWHGIEKGTLTKPELYRVRWNMIFEELGIRANGEKFEEDFRIGVAESAVHVEGAMELLVYLAKKYPLHVASNASHAQQVRRLEKAGMLPYIRQIFSSEQLGANKPSRAFFDACFEQLAPLEPKETVIIGDSLHADIGGGARYGLHTIWYNHDGMPVPDDCPADCVVNALDEIRQLL